MANHLHIICLNVPFPVDYGGVFDLFFKLPALQEQGVKIHLHCFEYGRGEQPELNKYCESVHYYARQNYLSALSLYYPFIVGSRNSKELTTRLLQDDYPILMEGTHCTYLLNDKRFTKRKCFVRVHNAEFVYYQHLFQFTKSIFRKAYLKRESKMLRKYEASICNKATFIAVTQKDRDAFQQLGAEKTAFLPLFLPAWEVKGAEGKGMFCLYHGDLSVAENEKAATWLIESVFKESDIPFVIAGKNPSDKLKKRVHQKSTVCLIANPDETEMQDLIFKAHINIIPSYNTTGVKVKLVNALYNGRYCLTNEATVNGSGLEKACVIASDAKSFMLAIERLYKLPFSPEDVALRHQVMDKMFNNTDNAERLVKMIWKEN